MAMTAEVKDELSRLVVNSVSARRAEVASLLRFAGGLHIVAGRVVVEAEVDLGIIARRLRKDIYDLYGVQRRGARPVGQWNPGRTPAMSCGWPPMGKPWPGRPGCSIFVDARCEACPRRWSAAASVTRRQRGAGRSWLTDR